MKSHKPYVAMLFVQLVYAGMALFSKAAISKGMNPFVFVVFRQALAFLALSPLAFFFESNKYAPMSYGLLFKIFLVSFCGLTLSLNLYCVAINHTTATFAAATTNIIPAITFIIAVCLRMESISIRRFHGIAKVVGAVMGVSGAMVFAFLRGPQVKIMLKWYMSSNNNQAKTMNHPTEDVSSSRDHQWVKGSLLMLSSNVLWSLWLVLQGPIVKQYPAKLRLTALQCFFSCVQSAFWAVAVERSPSAWKLGWDINLLSVVYCGVIVTGITYWLQVWAVEKKGPVFTAMFTPLALVVTAIFSAFLWKETLYWGRVGGALMLVGGLYCTLWGKIREDRKSQKVELIGAHADDDARSKEGSTTGPETV
ncbi:WAT1-related protein At1g43650 [Punica granatum]|uniref:WAT1-related protein n=2 Tax=Punica granatum TaxID=22663 RepID=A0A218XJA6_PUNGR|nr:WAT1-related protein At1g43650 [Punica granatum]OWM85043.1 hypothetical protein CDL15_Pgr027830 [Punica granatum]PKI57431.1 hypothetical protein CRG98_022082 [Punica granatum]